MAPDGENLLGASDIIWEPARLARLADLSEKAFNALCGSQVILAKPVHLEVDLPTLEGLHLAIGTDIPWSTE